MNFNNQFKFIVNHFAYIAKQEGLRPSKLALAKFLGISQGRMQRWENGQIPKPEDLKLLHEKFGFSYAWLLTGEGEPLDKEKSSPSSEEIASILDENIRLKEELAEADRINRKLVARLLIEGVTDEKSAAGTGAAAGQK